MDNVEKLYNDGKLLIRSMDQPILKREKIYECQTWIDEFNYLMNDGLFSLSTTLIIPNVGVKNYKNIGFLIDSNFADCFHIAKSDSGSSGNVKDGDFKANKKDYNTLVELANYIKNTNATTMNEVNVNVKLDGIVGLYINKCTISNLLLKKIYIVKSVLKYMTGIDYPIYLYDWNIGKIELIDLTKEDEENLIGSLESNQIYYWPDDIDKPELITISSEKTK